MIQVTTAALTSGGTYTLYHFQCEAANEDEALAQVRQYHEYHNDRLLTYEFGPDAHPTRLSAKIIWDEYTHDEVEA